MRRISHDGGGGQPLGGGTGWTCRDAELEGVHARNGEQTDSEGSRLYSVRSSRLYGHRSASYLMPHGPCLRAMTTACGGQRAACAHTLATVPFPRSAGRAASWWSLLGGAQRQTVGMDDGLEHEHEHAQRVGYWRARMGAWV